MTLSNGVEAIPSRRAILVAGTAILVASSPGWTQQAGRTYRIGVLTAEPDEIGPAIEAAEKVGAEALNVLPSPMLFANQKVIFIAAARARLPAIYEWPEQAEAGGLIANGPRLTSSYRQLARQLVKVLNGANPADVPVEQPTAFKLVVNLQTAKALGLAVSASLLTRADEVIE